MGGRTMGEFDRVIISTNEFSLIGVNQFVGI